MTLLTFDLWNGEPSIICIDRAVAILVTGYNFFLAAILLFLLEHEDWPRGNNGAAIKGRSTDKITTQEANAQPNAVLPSRFAALSECTTGSMFVKLSPPGQLLETGHDFLHKQLAALDALRLQFGVTALHGKGKIKQCMSTQTA